MPQESHTELDTTTPATVSSEPSTTESPTTDLGAADETATFSETSSEPTDAATNNSPTVTARTSQNVLEIQSPGLNLP